MVAVPSHGGSLAIAGTQLISKRDAADINNAFDYAMAATNAPKRPLLLR